MFPAILLFLVMLNQIYAPFSSVSGRRSSPISRCSSRYMEDRYILPPALQPLDSVQGLLQETLAGGMLGVEALSKGLTGFVWTRLWHRPSGTPLAPVATIGRINGVRWSDFLLHIDVVLLACVVVGRLLPLLSWQLLSNLLLGPFLLILLATVQRRLKRTRRFSRRRHESAVTFQPE